MLEDSPMPLLIELIVFSLVIIATHKTISSKNKIILMQTESYALGCSLSNV